MTKKATATITLNPEATRCWEDDGPDGDAYRHNVRIQARKLAAIVEIYSHDGIILDAVEAD